MKEIVETLKKRISENKNSMLVTVVAGRGSIPRKAGAYMVVGEDGRVTGTIGGGNLEYQATLMGQKLLTEKKNYLHEYNLGQEKSAELGMACGGNATVLFYFVDAREDAAWIRQMEEAEEKKEAFWILMPLEEGKIKILPEFQTFAHQSVTEIDGARFYAEQFSYDGKVYIFGGGHLAQELVPVLSHLGFRCIVSDDREEFTKPELFPGAEEIRLIDFGKPAVGAATIRFMHAFDSLVFNAFSMTFPIKSPQSKVPSALASIIFLPSVPTSPLSDFNFSS